MPIKTQRYGDNMVNLEKKTKPPTQGIGVSGFVAFKTPADEPKPLIPPQTVNWGKLLGLPPFEMYMSEKTGNMERNAWQAWLTENVTRDGESKVYQAYAEWHTAKGYWVGETPMGEVIDGY